jgi:hypothetical protein
MKLWIADRGARQWGAIMVWESAAPLAETLPPNRGAELIGRPPDCRMRFDVEAST